MLDWSNSISRIDPKSYQRKGWMGPNYLTTTKSKLYYTVRRCKVTISILGGLELTLRGRGFIVVLGAGIVQFIIQPSVQAYDSISTFAVTTPIFSELLKGASLSPGHGLCQKNQICPYQKLSNWVKPTPRTTINSGQIRIFRHGQRERWKNFRFDHYTSSIVWRKQEK